MKKPEPPARWQPYWFDVLRAAKRALLATTRVAVGGHVFRVAYEARGRFDQADYSLLARLAARHRCIFDVGANVGLTALTFAATQPDAGLVYAFEASEAACLVIRENAILNGYADRIRIINALVAEESGSVVELHWNYVAGNASMMYDAPSGTRSIPLSKATLALDDFVDSTGIAPDLVKIDVEGAEARVVAGLSKTLQRHRPTLFIELHAWPGMTLESNAQQIEAIISECGYEMTDAVTEARLEGARHFRVEPGRKTPEYSRAWIVLRPLESTHAGSSVPQLPASAQVNEE